MQPRWRKRIFAVVDDVPPTSPLTSIHVGGVAGLASGFGILFGKQRPQPVLVVAVGFLDAGGGAAVALVAGRAAELVGIVSLQQFRLGMAGEGVGILVGLLLALARHDRGRDPAAARARPCGRTRSGPRCWLPPR